MNDQTILSTGWSPARLVVRQGTQAGQEFTLTQDAAILGRDAGLDISIQDPEMSRRHARISWQQGDYVLEDLGSTNGTMVNDVQIKEPCTLQTGDSIGVGQTVLEFVWQAGTPPQPVVYAPAAPEPPTFQAPPVAPSPGPAAAPGKKKKNNCLLYGCGCLVLLALLVAIVLVLVLLLMPDQIQPVFDEYGVPIRLVQSIVAPGLLSV